MVPALYTMATKHSHLGWIISQYSGRCNYFFSFSKPTFWPEPCLCLGWGWWHPKERHDADDDRYDPSARNFSRQCFSLPSSIGHTQPRTAICSRNIQNLSQLASNFGLTATQLCLKPLSYGAHQPRGNSRICCIHSKISRTEPVEMEAHAWCRNLFLCKSSAHWTSVLNLSPFT